MLPAAWIPLYWVWKRAGESRFVPLALLPCLQLDACFALYAASGFIGQVIPQYPAWVGVIVPAAACVLIPFLSGVHGTGYGTAIFQWLLLGLFVLSCAPATAPTGSGQSWQTACFPLPKPRCTARAACGRRR